jgi:hypothetical protein
MRTCTVDDCDRRHVGRGYCGTHYMQFKRTGAPQPQRREDLRCDVDGCDKAHHARGYCALHAARLSRTGDPTTTRRPKTVEAFWRRVDKAAPGGHWLWMGEELRNGYGRISTRNKPSPSGSTLAHRVSWELRIGPIPENLVIDHVCRVKLCVRPHPDHLELVTSLENVRRGLHGELRTHCNYGHELTPENTRLGNDGARRCRSCARRWWADARKRKREAGLRLSGVDG